MRQDDGKYGAYDRLRRARRDELRHRDHAGLRDLMQDYFSLADELELEEHVPPPSRAA